MRKSYLIGLAVSAAIMVLLPWLTVTFVKGDAAMAVCFLLFFGVNPIFSIAMGIFSGKGRKVLWSLPILTSALFILVTWAFFGMGEPAFLVYAGIYLILGMISMGVTYFLSRNRSEN